MPNTTATTKLQLCTHAFKVGRICGSPALRGERFCYFHHPTRKKVLNPNERQARRVARQRFTLTPPTNAVELQLAINEIIVRLAANAIDPRRAGLILSALQFASYNFSPGEPLPPQVRT